MSAKSAKDRTLIAIIGDEDSVTGMLLAGIGNVSEDGDEGRSKNFFVVDPKTEASKIEQVFNDYTQRPDIAIVLINQHVAEKIRYLVDSYSQAFPALLEIPSKDHPYDPEKDTVLKRVRRLFGE